MKVGTRKGEGGRQSFGVLYINYMCVCVCVCMYSKLVGFYRKAREPRIWASDPNIDQLCDPGQVTLSYN